MRVARWIEPWGVIFTVVFGLGTGLSGKRTVGLAAGILVTLTAYVAAETVKWIEEGERKP